MSEREQGGERGRDVDFPCGSAHKRTAQIQYSLINDENKETKWQNYHGDGEI